MRDKPFTTGVLREGLGRGGDACQLGEALYRVQALVGLRADGRDDQAVDAGALVALQALGHLVLAAHEGGRIDELVGDRGIRVLPLAIEVQRLDLVRHLAEAEAVGEVDVEVRLAAPHAAQVEQQTRLDDPARRVEVAVDGHLHRRRDLEVRARAPALLEAGLDVLVPRLAERVGRGEDRNPPVCDLGGDLHGPAPDRAQEDRDRVAHGMEVQLERLALAVRERELEVLAVVLQALIPRDDLADDLHVLARAAPRLWIRSAEPALRDLRAGGPETEYETAAGES